MGGARTEPRAHHRGPRAAPPGPPVAWRSGYLAPGARRIRVGARPERRTDRLPPGIRRRAAPVSRGPRGESGARRRGAPLTSRVARGGGAGRRHPLSSTSPLCGRGALPRLRRRG